MKNSFLSKNIKVCFKALVALGLSSVLFGCAMKSVSNTQTPLSQESHKQVQTHEQLQTSSEHVTPLNFNYPVHIAQAPSNNHFVGILVPHIQVSDNLKPYINQFQDALVNQIQSIFEKRGYQVLRFQDKNALSLQDKKKIFSVLDLKGWVGILEDLKMNLKDPNKPNLDTLVDQSSGSVWFNFYEPESNRVIHDFGVEVGTFQAITHTITYKDNNSGGFNSVDSVEQTSLEKNKKDAIHKILNRMYAVVMKRVIAELTEDNISKYRNAIDKMKGFKKPIPKR
ncbi:HpaA family protein [Helicobacter cetorum]|uniref:Neuraminyllactose-binding hemagglutinin n=1 Tax=Helicobacter cetorum (strain ATCC BAA-540 / CCUG 52418 / MIT 99-5656) TaxID=1163745 RepID=I0EQX8_HELCM|nr:neuraminyllactose-binding hemagglutinin [Helicobacter cetorum]AFI05347.1 HpaA-like protein [Helicobacter cetorum MIT 99-5656]